MAEFKLYGDDVLDTYSGHGDPVFVKLKIWDPAAGVPRRGTVVFGSGGSGSSFLSEEFFTTPPPNEIDIYYMAEMYADLAWMGYRVIDRAWVNGWTATGSKDYGERVAASRYATLIEEVYSKYHCADCGAFVVVGHSGGSAEIAFGLTSYGLGNYIDLAVLVSGPAVAQLDQECVNPDPDVCDSIGDNDTWCAPLYCEYRPNVSLCPGDWNGKCDSEDQCCSQGCGPGDVDLTFDRPACVFAAGDGTCEGPCKDDPEDETDDGFPLDNSVLFSGSASNFPRTTVHVVLGLKDVNQGPTGGLAVYDHVTSRKRLQFVDIGHSVLGNSEGRRAVKNAVEWWTRPFVGDVNYSGIVDSYDDYIVSLFDEDDLCRNDPDGNPDANNDGQCDSGDAAVVSRVRGCPNCTNVSLQSCDEGIIDLCGLEYVAPASSSACLNTHAGFSGGVSCQDTADCD